MSKISPLRVIKFILLAILFFFLGYYRNNVFVSINERMACLYWRTAYPPLKGPLALFESCTYDTLITIKWLLTFGFTLVFTLLSIYTLNAVFKSRMYTQLCIVVYAGLFAVSLLFMVADKLIPGFNVHGYNISRSLMHLAQSPVLTFVLLLGIYFYRKQQ